MAHLRRSLVAKVGVVMITLLICGSFSSCASTRPAPKVRAEVGFALGGGINDLSDAAMIEQLDALAALGVDWIRVDFAWSVIETVEGNPDWARTDLIVEAAAERGMEVLALLAYTPRWARPDDTSDKHPPIDPERFGSFVDEVAARYRQDVSHWEIWNEPNHAPFWEGGIDPQAYARLFTEAATAIRAEIPRAVIISGGLSPAVDDSPSMRPETFIDGFLPLVAPELIDGLGVHPYSWPAAPSDDGKGWNTFGRLPAMKAQADGYVPGLTFWLTEYGAPTDAVTEEEQAALIREAVNCATRWEWAGPLFVYTWRDWPAERFGVVTETGEQKPAFAALQTLTNGGAEAQSCDLS